MTTEKLQQWLNTTSEHINSMIRLMCGMQIKDAKYSFEIESSLDGNSWCALDTDKNHIKIHIGIPEWFNDEFEHRDLFVEALGHDPDENDLFAIYMGAAMHEFMHAAITRSGSIFDELVAKFPMKQKNPTRFQKDFYSMNVEKVFRKWFNCVCDARIENIGKQIYNVASYFDFHRLIDYAVATKSSGSEAFDFGYALLQLGVIGRLPQYELSPESLVAIKAITEQPIIGSIKTKDNLEEFICEPHPTISAKMFASWFDIPEVHAYVEKLFEEEIESQSEAAQKLADMLKNLPQEVTIRGRSAKGCSSPIPLSIPITIKASQAKPGDDDDEEDGADSDSGTTGNSANEKSGKDGKGKVTISTPNSDDQEKGDQSGSGKAKNEQKPKTKDGNGGDSSKSDKDGNQGSEDSTKNGSDASSGDSDAVDQKKDSDGNGNDGKSRQSNSTDSQDGKNNGSDGKDQSDQDGHQSTDSADSREFDGQSTDSNDVSDTSDSLDKGGDHSKASASHSDKDNSTQQKSKGDTFDKDGNWNTHGDGSKTLDKAPILKDDPQLRAAIDQKIQEIAPKANAVHAKAQEAQKKKRQPQGTNYRNLSTAGLVVDKSFKPHLVAPQKVIRMAKPLRAVLKRAFATEQEDDITGLKAGSLHSASLYRLGQKDLSVFKVHRLPTINTAVYFFLWDGSGSMQGEKQMESGIACATIEEAVRGLYPFKIMNFYTYGNGVVHHVVKDFDEKSKKNYAYSFASMRSFNGGNKDGFAIKCAVEDLIKRKETNKFLYVLSDGAPSAYGSMEAGVKDVQNAVAFARKNHIDVTSIFFGSGWERNQQIDLYKKMYGAGHIIACEPSDIVNHLIAIVKKNIHK